MKTSTLRCEIVVVSIVAIIIVILFAMPDLDVKSSIIEECQQNLIAALLYRNALSWLFYHTVAQKKIARRVWFVSAGDGWHSYRLFDTMAMGVVPVILADDWALPFEDILDWDSFAIRVAYGNISHLGENYKKLRTQSMCYEYYCL